MFFEACVGEATAAHVGQACAKLLLNVGARLANERDTNVQDLGITPAQVRQVVELRDRDAIGSSAADELFALLCQSDGKAADVAGHNGLLQVRDEGRLAAWCREAIEAQPQAADDVRAGKGAALGRLVGEVMKRSGGQADAKAAREQLAKLLEN